MKPLVKILARLVLLGVATFAIARLADTVLFTSCSFPKDRERSDQRRVEAAAEMFVADHQRCPRDLEELISVRILSSRDQLDDAWKRARRFECTDDHFVIWSAGPDRTFGNADDIHSVETR